MTTVKLGEPRRAAPASRFALFNLGFRPFFALAGGAAVALLLIWILMFTGHWPAPDYYGLTGWHRHEMIFAYAGAVICGFLLTAARNWTGVDTPSGVPLALLAGLWLAARLLPFMDVPGWLVALVDLSFFPLVAIALARPLLSSDQRSNQLFLLILMLFAAANAALHGELLGWWSGISERALDAGLALVVLVMLVFGGRVIPFFTEIGLGRIELTRIALVEKLAVPVVLLWIATTVVAPVLLPVVAVLAALVHGRRLAGWYRRALWQVPLLWVLHLGYAWIVLGFVLQALAGLGVVSDSLASHAFATGGVGVLTMGMMARISLGHTGHQMQSACVINFAFALVNLAAALRVLGPLLFPPGYSAFLWLSALTWAGAFLLFCVVYWPMLAKPRVDGQPG